MNRPHEICLAGDTTFTTSPSEFRHKELNDFLAGLTISKTEMIDIAKSCKEELRAAGFGSASTLLRSCDLHERHYWVTIRTFVMVDGETVGQIALALPHKPVSPSATPKPVDFYVSNPEVVGDDKLKIVADILLAQIYQFSRLGTVAP